MTGMFRYWPRRKVIPRGWVLHCLMPLPHGRYSVLIRKLERTHG